jgi:hypothetical protein
MLTSRVTVFHEHALIVGATKSPPATHIGSPVATLFAHSASTLTHKH